MSKEQNSFQKFLARKNIVFSAKRYGIDALVPWHRDSLPLF